jgi:hypothetical protein
MYPELGAVDHGAEVTCLGATDHGAEVLGLKTISVQHRTFVEGGSSIDRFDEAETELDFDRRTGKE